MKKYAKLLQVDKRGQIVIPKDVRQLLNISEETGFYLYAIPGEGILLKQIDAPEIGSDSTVEKLTHYAQQLGINEQAITHMVHTYTKSQNLEDIQ